MENTEVYYRHYRYRKASCGSNRHIERYYRSGKYKSTWMPEAKGGKIECVTNITYGGNPFEVMATANYNKTNLFCYKTGRDLARFRLELFLGHIKAMENLVAERV